jgi:hypothetical protein
MDGIRKIAPRLSKEGKLLMSGWNIPKFHMLVHLISQIQQFGPPVFWDVEAGESNHKFTVKNNAVTCQKRGGGVFLRQLSLRMWANQTLWLMCSWIGVNRKDTDVLVEGRCPGVFVNDQVSCSGNQLDDDQAQWEVGHTNTRLTTTLVMPIVVQPNTSDSERAPRIINDAVGGGDCMCSLVKKQPLVLLQEMLNYWSRAIKELQWTMRTMKGNIMQQTVYR